MTKHNQAHAAFVTTSFVSNPEKKMASMILFVTKISDKGEEFLMFKAIFNVYDTVPSIQMIQEMFTYTNVCVLGDLPGLWGQCVFLGVSDHFKRSLTKNCHVVDLLSVFLRQFRRI